MMLKSYQMLSVYREWMSYQRGTRGTYGLNEASRKSLGY